MCFDTECDAKTVIGHALVDALVLRAWRRDLDRAHVGHLFYGAVGRDLEGSTVEQPFVTGLQNQE